MSEVSAHDVCRLSQPWLLVLLKPAQSPTWLSDRGGGREQAAESVMRILAGGQPSGLKVRPPGLQKGGSWKLHPSAPASGPMETEI